MDRAEKIPAVDRRNNAEHEDVAVKSAEDCNESRRSGSNVQDDLVGTKHDADGLDEDDPPGLFRSMVSGALEEQAWTAER